MPIILHGGGMRKRTIERSQGTPLRAWQRHGEGRSPLRFAINRNRPMVGTGYGDSDGKTKARAANRRAIGSRNLLAAVEAIKNVRQVFGRDALSSIDDLDNSILALFVKTQDD